MFNVSVRGWLAILLIGSACFGYLLHMLAATTIAIHNGDMAVFNNDFLKVQNAMAERLALVALGYYFGKAEEHLSRKKPSQGKSPRSPRRPRGAFADRLNQFD